MEVIACCPPLAPLLRHSHRAHSPPRRLLHEIQLAAASKPPGFCLNFLFQSSAYGHLPSSPALLHSRKPNFCCYADRGSYDVQQSHEQQHQHQQQHNSSIRPKDDSDRRKPFGFRLRARLRLVLRSLRRWYPKVLLQACLRYVRAHVRQVALSTVIGFGIAVGCLCLNLSSISSPHIVPYSELVRHLHARTVTRALFEEGSRRVFFNVKPENEQTASDSLSSQSEAAVDEDIAEQGNVGLDTGRKSVASILTTSLKAVAGKPEQLLKSQPHPWKYSTRRIEHDETYLLNLMRESGITYSSAPQPTSVALRTILITILTLWIPLSPLLWLMHRQFSNGNAQAQRRRLSNQSVRFEDVAGVDEARLELMEVVSCLRGATNFRKLGAKLPKGVLLVGPPGTGKTLLARAVAGEAGVPFFAASASEFVEMFVGRGAARIRELFAGARKCAPSIIFIDELDAVGGRRGRSFNDERDQTLNQLLTEMDGFESETGVLVIAATNRPEALDPALCRPGRFSRKVFVREPNLKGREQILAVHMRGVPVEGDVEVVRNVVASITWGFVGADLANVVNEAALLAVRQGRSVVLLEDFKGAVVRVKFGVGDKPAFSQVVEREIGRLFGLFQPKALKSVQDGAPASLGYEAAPWGG